MNALETKVLKDYAKGVKFKGIYTGDVFESTGEIGSSRTLSENGCITIKCHNYDTSKEGEVTVLDCNYNPFKWAEIIKAIVPDKETDLTISEKINYIRIGLGLAGVSVNDVAAETIVLVYEKILQKKGSFNIEDAVKIQHEVESNFLRKQRDRKKVTAVKEDDNEENQLS